MKGSAGCDSVATLILTVSQATTSTTTKEVCPAQLPYSWHGQSYTQAGTYTAALKGSAGCDSVATLILTISQATTSTTTKEVCPAQLPYSWNGQSYTQAGTYTAALKGSAGCDSVPTFILTLRTATTSTTTKELCPAQLSYNWNGQSYFPTRRSSDLLKGSAGCDSVATLILTISQATTSTTTKEVCPAQLPYSWNGQSYTQAGTYTAALKGSAG